jgi:hypothetical protein
MRERSDLQASASEVVGLAGDLIRIGTTHHGAAATLAGGDRAAEYVATTLSEIGYDVTYPESGARMNLPVESL